MATMHYPTEPPRRGDKTIQKALAILERRLRQPGPAVASPSAARDYLVLRMAELQREEFMVLFLDSQSRVLSAETMFTGTLTQTSIYPREVVRRAMHHNAAAVILAHNHPAGVSEPSQADRYMTEQLKGVLGMVDVKVLDHFIVAGPRCLSFAERGWM